MISKEVEMVLNGEYCNPELDARMGDMLLDSISRCDISAYMNWYELRTNVICDRYYEKLQEQNSEIGFGL